MEPETDPIPDQADQIDGKSAQQQEFVPVLDSEQSPTPPLGSSPPNLDESSSVSLTEPNDVRSDSEDVFSDGEDYDYMSSSEDEPVSEDEAPLAALPPIEEPKLFSQIKDITVDVLDLTEQQTDSISAECVPFWILQTTFSCCRILKTFHLKLISHTYSYSIT
jgi:hypothetical protein